ncbi:VWA domain-containing protein [Verrucomicrobiota bacterium]|nr:VWA domain-containing protein [Verrucomicrobiota bacterium]
MLLTQPIWLLLLIPLGAVWFFWPLPTRGLRVLRAALFAALVLALCHPAIRLPDRAGTVVVVADRSDSMPAETDTAQKETIALLQKSMRARDQLAVVSFGRQTAVERSPQQGEFAGFTAQVGGDQSNLHDALESALALVPPGSPGRVLVLSDGKWTGRDPATAAARAAGRGVAIDYRRLARAQAHDLAIQEFQAPESVQPGQSYMLNAWVSSPTPQEIQYELKRGGQVLSAGARSVPAGLSRLIFRDRATQAGVAEYHLRIAGAEKDPVPENNQARALTGIRGPRPLLLVAEAGAKSGLAQLLQRGGVDVTARTPAECRWTLEELARYSAVLLENVLAEQLGVPGMETLAAWVEETGGGVMLTGGKKSYAPGGYFKSPLERVLPVSLEMRKEHRKLNLAIVVALDRSGSMAASVGGGRVKMDLANLGTAQVLDLLSESDELGVIAVDTSPHTIVDLSTVDRVRGERGKILSMKSMGGGIYIYEALVAASKMILRAKASTKHIILFADAADSEQPGNYRELLEQIRKADITVSVVGLGTTADKDAELLQDIARRGAGTCYFSNNPEELPRIFAQDTFTVARSTFIEEPTALKLTGGFTTLGGRMDWQPPMLGGYNLTYLRPEANLAIVTQDEFAAPAVAAWQAGAGRALCYAGEADGQFAGALAKWAQAGDFYATLARWTAGDKTPLPDNLLLTQEVRDGVDYVQLHLDPERREEPFATLPRLRVLHGIPGQPPGKMTLTMQWKTADLLEAVVPVRGQETVLATAEIPGLKAVSLPPVCLPYSPEFAPEQAGKGREALEKLAGISGGQERANLAALWQALPAQPQFIELTPWVIVFAIAAFLLEILERRTGWMGLARRRRTVAATAAGAKAGERETVAEKRVPRAAEVGKIPPAVVATTVGNGDPAVAAPVAAPEANVGDAMRQASRRAQLKNPGGRSK